MVGRLGKTYLIDNLCNNAGQATGGDPENGLKGEGCMLC